jgi:hypothetical protein
MIYREFIAMEFPEPVHPDLLQITLDRKALWQEIKGLKDKWQDMNRAGAP